jgi:hypothetical protein
MKHASPPPPQDQIAGQGRFHPLTAAARAAADPIAIRRPHLQQCDPPAMVSR